MVSAFENPDQPPLMTPESQTPSLLRRGMANMQGGLDGPKAQIVSAMLAQSLGKMFNPGLMTNRASQVDPYAYGNQ